ncbi:GGDEF domain-containing protein [Marinobacterium sediminicola]|uniref:diguanylate cyclase n=1 Tax=Marinobacterium sediminicola TaxID=518898 RepID=A0ABY1RYZ5_9GAMM|nr:GGDEF domain-containing protein [Marinobacterium sediminicola]ULG68047.1 GGDEF domain-containing protein [Marinobacterium sediminicola]SMR73443.1 diguanylate cyclase (GGDEF) domain-containing protein [Marinobacterium sediminicola]
MFVQRHSIGTRLNLIIGVIFGLYLIVVSAVGYVMYRQYDGFSNLASTHFGRAMAAAELTRDAEIIAAEVFEIMVGSRRSISAGNQRTENLASLYQTARDRLEQLGATEQLDSQTRAELERWQEPFFESLSQLGDQLDREESLRVFQLQRFDELFLLLQQLPLDSLNSFSTNEHLFVSHALAALTSAAAGMSAERPGHIEQLEKSCRQSIQRMQALPMDDIKWKRLAAKFDLVLPATFESRQPFLQNARATLATARHTRVLAQKLTSATYNYHLQLKASAQEAIADYQRLIRHSLLGLLLSSLALIAVTIGAILYIRRHIVSRINRLSHAMQDHLNGNPVPIPQSGQDEISVMGATFSVFVDARREAERQLETANQHLHQVNQNLKELSVTDALTGVYNRRQFDQKLEQEWRRARRQGENLALIMADVDLFKRFNDAFGHQQGDSCLRRVAQEMLSQLNRSGDIIARYGGEEFIILLPGLDLQQAAQLAEKLRSVVYALNIPHHSPSGRVTISLGVAAEVPCQERRMESLVHDADQALYSAKDQGRNRVCLSAPEVSE